MRPGPSSRCKALPSVGGGPITNRWMLVPSPQRWLGKAPGRGHPDGVRGDPPTVLRPGPRHPRARPAVVMQLHSAYEDIVGSHPRVAVFLVQSSYHSCLRHVFEYDGRSSQRHQVPRSRPRHSRVRIEADSSLTKKTHFIPPSLISYLRCFFCCFRLIHTAKKRSEKARGKRPSRQREESKKAETISDYLREETEHF